jgi:protease-4
VAVEARYFRRALDKIGIQPEVFARGEFKTAGEALLRDSMSPPQREQLGAVLDALHGELVTALSEGRGAASATALSWIDEGPYRAGDAIARGLVDAAGYDDELPNLVAPGATRPTALIAADDYLAARRRYRPRRKPHIGVIHVRGPIVSRAPIALGRVAVDERVVGAIRRAREDRATEGVVLFIDSPGGGVLASDRIYHEVVRLAEKKPVVAYFGNVAASGGYYVAAGAHRIVAQPTTITGSIGVVAAHLVIGPLLEKLGIVTELVKRGARSDMMSTSRPLDEGERAAVDREMDGFYRDFVAIVARGRKRQAEEVEKLARGRVYSGRDAHAHGLVDRLGGFDMALDDVRERLGDKRRRLDPRPIKAPKTTPKPPEMPVPFVEAFESAALGSQVGQLVVLAMGTEPSERVLAWSPWSLAQG